MLEPALAALQADPAAAEAAAETFQQLRPVCAQLLHLRNDPQGLTAALRVLHGLLDGASPLGLRRCFDYVTYPLLYMLDAVVAVRAAARGPAHASSSSGSGAPSDNRQPQSAIPVPAMQHDVAAEALLQCVLVLLQRCPGLEADQLMPVLQHLGGMMQLPREQLSEEVRAQHSSCVMCNVYAICPMTVAMLVG